MVHKLLGVRWRWGNDDSRATWGVPGTGQGVIHELPRAGQDGLGAVLGVLGLGQGVVHELPVCIAEMGQKRWAYRIGLP